MSFDEYGDYLEALERIATAVERLAGKADLVQAHGCLLLKG